LKKPDDVWAKAREAQPLFTLDLKVGVIENHR
jgi:hypothetical protein